MCNFFIICWTDVLSLVLWTAVWSFGKHWLWMKILLFAISECWMHDFDFFRFHSCKHLFDLFNPCESCSLNLALYELISCCLSSLPETLLSSCVTTSYQGFILFVMSFWCNRGTSFQAIISPWLKLNLFSLLEKCTLLFCWSSWTDQFAWALFLQLHLSSANIVVFCIFSSSCELLLFSSTLFSASAVPIFSS